MDGSYFLVLVAQIGLCLAFFLFVDYYAKLVSRVVVKLGKKPTSKIFNMAGWQGAWLFVLPFLTIGMSAHDALIYGGCGIAIAALLLFLQAFAYATVPRISAEKAKSLRRKRYPKQYNYFYQLGRALVIIVSLATSAYLARVFFTLDSTLLGEDAIYFTSQAAMIGWYLLAPLLFIGISGIARLLALLPNNEKWRSYLQRPRKAKVGEYGIDNFATKPYALREILICLILLPLGVLCVAIMSPSFAVTKTTIRYKAPLSVKQQELSVYTLDKAEVHINEYKSCSKSSCTYNIDPSMKFIPLTGKPVTLYGSDTLCFGCHIGNPRNIYTVLKQANVPITKDLISKEGIKNIKQYPDDAYIPLMEFYNARSKEDLFQYAKH